MGLFSRIFGQFFIDDESPQSQWRDFEPIVALGNQFGVEIGHECDVLPSGSGTFGSITNPIPVNGSKGETVYLNRLRSPSDVGFYYHRLGSVASPAAKHPIDHFELLAVDGATKMELFFDMYHPRRSQTVPNGLTRTSWKNMDPLVRSLIKLDLSGSKTRVPDFPYGLPDAIEQSVQLRAVSPGLAKTVADRMRTRLMELRCGYQGPVQESVLRRS